MKRWIGPAWMAGGTLLGALATAFVLGAAPLPFVHKRPSALQRLPMPLQARVLLTREAQSIVKLNQDGAGGVELFSRPEAAGGGLCRVRTYRFYGEELSKSPDVVDRYGLWTSPSEVADKAAGAGERICPTYEDFDHLIWGRPEEIIAVTHVVDRARIAAKAATAEFAVTCIGSVEARRRPPCDGLGYLGSLDLKDIQEARDLGDPFFDPRPGARRQLWVYVNDGRLHGHPQMTTLTITTEEVGHMEDPRIVSIAIDRQAY